MQNYSRTTFLLLIIFDYYPNFGIGDFVAGTTPVALIKQTFTFYGGLHLLTLTDGFVFHQIVFKLYIYRNYIMDHIVYL